MDSLPLSHKDFHTNIQIIGVPEKREREKMVRNRFDEIMADHILNLKKETEIQIQGWKRVQQAEPIKDPHRGIIY